MMSMRFALVFAIGVLAGAGLSIVAKLQTGGTATCVKQDTGITPEASVSASPLLPGPEKTCPESLCSDGGVKLTLHTGATKKWEDIQKRPDSDPIFQLGDQKIWEPFEPVASCADETRVGDLGDGGKWICGLQYVKAPCVIYSVGSHGEAAFELAVNELTNSACEIHTFDPYEPYGEKWPSYPKNMFFHGIGLSSHDHEIQMTTTGEIRVQYNAKLRSFKTITSMLNHTHINIMKADIEGAEFSAIPDIFANNADIVIDQMQWEIHAYRSGSAYPLFKKMSDNGYVMFHKELNHLCVPCCEYAWMKKSYVRHTAP